MDHQIITIDGPAGAGKTTVSRLLARELNCVYVDTGALYRGVAYEIDQQGIDWRDDEVLDGFLGQLDLDFVMGKQGLVLMSSGKDITSFIRTSKISMLASATSARPSVRAALLGIQKQIAAKQDAVFEGRDMGTVVFPEAQFKFYLFADLEVRARRRYHEMPRGDASVEKIQDEMARRDSNDSQRKQAPLRIADDAVKFDSTHLTVRKVVDKMLENIRKS